MIREQERKRGEKENNERRRKRKERMGFVKGVKKKEGAMRERELGNMESW
jgi:hypothetical protein